MIHLALLRLFFIGALANEVDPGVVARLTRERVRQIQVEALKLLKSILAEKGVAIETIFY